MAYCSLRNEMERNEMKICSLRNENLLSRCVYSYILNKKFPPKKPFRPESSDFASCDQNLKNPSPDFSIEYTLLSLEVSGEFLWQWLLLSLYSDPFSS